MPRKRAVEPSYSALLKVAGRVLKASGKTPIEAISNLNAQGIHHAVGVLTVSRGTRSSEKILSRFQITKLFSPSRVVREYALKGVGALFDF